MKVRIKKKVEQEDVHEVDGVEEEFLMKRDWKRLWLKKKKVTAKSIKQPVLLLMRDNSDLDIIQGVKSGMFEIVSSFNKAENKCINLNPNKLLNLNYGGESIKCWVAYESEAVTYPLDVNQDSRDQYQIIKRLAMNYKDLSLGSIRGKKVFKIVLITIAVLIIIGTLAVSSGVVDLGGTGGGFLVR